MRNLFSGAFSGETSPVLAGLDGHGRVAEMVDDMVAPVRPVRRQAEGAGPADGQDRAGR
jgi:hypothetical protein